MTFQHLLTPQFRTWFYVVLIMLKCRSCMLWCGSGENFRPEVTSQHVKISVCRTTSVNKLRFDLSHKYVRSSSCCSHRHQWHRPYSSAVRPRTSFYCKAVSSSQSSPCWWVCSWFVHRMLSQMNSVHSRHFIVFSVRWWCIDEGWAVRELLTVAYIAKYHKYSLSSDLVWNLCASIWNICPE